MSNDLMLSKLAPLPVALQGTIDNSDLTAGVSGGFSVISYRGKVWRIKHQGEERPMMREDGDGARSSIEVIIVKAAPAISKIYYKNGFEDGVSTAPDCWSTNGQTPDPAASAKQSNVCASCPHNLYGSRITEAGKQAKACSDSRRLAIVPLGDIENELLGGPMLLRVPATSLKVMEAFAAKLSAAAYPYWMVGIRISFDINEAFPKFVMGAIRTLTADEIEQVRKLRGDPEKNMVPDPRIERILNEQLDITARDTDVQFEQQPAKPVARGLSGLAAAPKAAPVTPVVSEDAPDDNDIAIAEAAIAAAADKAKAEKAAKTKAAKAEREKELQAAADAKAAAAEAKAAKLAALKAQLEAEAAEPEEEDEEAKLLRMLAEAKAKKAAAAGKAPTVIEGKATEVKTVPTVKPAPVETSDSDIEDDFDAMLNGMMNDLDK